MEAGCGRWRYRLSTSILLHIIRMPYCVASGQPSCIKTSACVRMWERKLNTERKGAVFAFLRFVSGGCDYALKPLQTAIESWHLMPPQEPLKILILGHCFQNAASTVGRLGTSSPSSLSSTAMTAHPNSDAHKKDQTRNKVMLAFVHFTMITVSVAGF